MKGRIFQMYILTKMYCGKQNVMEKVSRIDCGHKSIPSVLVHHFETYNPVVYGHHSESPRPPAQWPPSLMWCYGGKAG